MLTYFHVSLYGCSAGGCAFAAGVHFFRYLFLFVHICLLLCSRIFARQVVPVVLFVSGLSQALN